jgi:hypothetical protein
MSLAGKGNLSLFGQLLAPAAQVAVPDAEIALNLDLALAAGFQQLERFKFELFGV